MGRTEFLARMRANIAASGRHITLVRGGETPRFAYTVGLTEAGRPELVLAGAASLGRAQVLLLGALDYYEREHVPALQLVPEEPTIDVPGSLAALRPGARARLALARWRVADGPDEPRRAAGPRDHRGRALGGGLLGGLLGSRLATPEDERHLVPLATLIGFDASLRSVAQLAVGEGLIRDDHGDPWATWR